MPIISITDIHRRIYEETVEVITREESALVDSAIESAIDEAKMYLHKFDLTALFGVGGTPATVTSSKLKNVCVSLAVWELIQLGQGGIDYEIARNNRKDALTFLKDIQGGKAQPDGWTYKDTTGETVPDGNSIYYTSNPKRKHHL